MGYGPIRNGKQLPISSWQGSWAQQEQNKTRTLPATPPGTWPLGVGPTGIERLKAQREADLRAWDRRRAAGSKI